MTLWTPDTTLSSVWLGRLAFTLLLACAACGNDDDPEDDEGTAGRMGGVPCVTGTAYDCSGPGNCRGRQVCNAGVLSACRCTDQPGDMIDAAAPRDAATDSDAEPARDAAPEQDAATADASTTAENCDNDTDDDGDGDADCADSDCTARTCVAAAPDGWSGPVLLYEGSADPPACSAGYPDEAVRGGTTVTGGAATCSACSCSPTTPGCSAFLNFETSLSSTCGAAPGQTCTFPVNSSCAELQSPCLTQATGYVETLLPAAPSTCTPATQQPTAPPASWDRQALACAPDEALAAAGCDADQLCAPAKPFDGELCIYDYFDVPCPAGPYSDRRVYGTHIADTRGCSACECAHDCAYTWRVFDPADTTCAGSAVAAPTEENECLAVNPGTVSASGGRLRVGASIAGTGACAPSGGTPTGSAQAQNPITVCCLP